MVTPETRTYPPETQTASVQMIPSGTPAELSIQNVLKMADWFNRPSYTGFEQFIGRNVRGQIDTNLAELLIRGTYGVRTQDLGAIGLYWNAERELLKQEVYVLLKKAGEGNWDGEEALALNEETVAIAQDLIDRFPPYTTRPEVAATPHGEVDFDWIIDREAMLTVSVCPSKEIVFAGLFHGARLNGSEPWSGVLPHFVTCCFERLRDAQNT